MLKSKIASLVLAGIMTIGGTGVTAFAAKAVDGADTTSGSIMTAVEESEKTPTMSFDKEGRKAEMSANREAKQAEMAEKSERLNGGKDAFMAKLLESGKTQEEIDAMMEKMSAKLSEKKANMGAERGAKKAAAAEKGVVKGSRTTGGII